MSDPIGAMSATPNTNSGLPFGLAPSGQHQESGTPPLVPNPGPGYGLTGTGSSQANPATNAAQNPGNNQAQGNAAQSASGQGNQAQGNAAQSASGQGNQAQGNAAQSASGQGNQAQAGASQGSGQESQDGQATAQSKQLGLLTSEAEAPDVEHQPITDFSLVDLKLGDAQVDKQILDGFAKLATEQGLTPAQARALAQWQVQENKRFTEAHVAAQSEQLKNLWGKEYGQNSQKVHALVTRLDRMTGLERFSQELASSGAANNATVLHGLYTISQMLSEDSMGRSQGTGAGTETALEGLQDAYNRARGRY